jgi:hypothetical protein
VKRQRGYVIEEEKGGKIKGELIVKGKEKIHKRRTIP